MSDTKETTGHFIVEGCSKNGRFLVIISHLRMRKSINHVFHWNTNLLILLTHLNGILGYE